MKKAKFSIQVGGKDILVEKNEMAEQADGSILVRMGDSLVLCTAVMSKHPSGLNYFPLNVEYQEKFYASGKIPGSFLKREGRPSDVAILKSRLIDRTLRPLFDHDIENNIQVVATVLSADLENDTDIIAMNAASIALMISDIPFGGPIAAVRVGRIDGKFVINPTFQEREQSDLDLVVAGTKDKINMIEAGANEVPETEVLKAIEYAKKEISRLVDFYNEITAKIGKQKRELEIPKPPQELVDFVLDKASEKIDEILFGDGNKKEKMEELGDFKKELLSLVEESFPENPEYAGLADKVFEKEIDRITHVNALKHKKRADGRKPDELREIKVVAGLIPRTHGSGFFKRGQTQALSLLTLGSPAQSQILDTMDQDTKKYFMHHYNFPPFSVGEAAPLRGPSRRDIGHGNLAERAIYPILPDHDEFPYTIRIVSEILSSNGSSSMASVCGSSVALMDGGVPIKKIAAGIAMGLMTDYENKDNYVVLTDIQGPEDHHGDMDFKVAGTKDGITALQMDVKIEGVTLKMLEDTLKQAKKARLQIIEKIEHVIPKPRTHISKFAPYIEKIQIDPTKIGLVIGAGGKTINHIIAESGAEVAIEEDGSVFVSGKNKEVVKHAIKMIEALTKEPKVGEIYEGRVTKITDFGAFVEFLPGKEGLVHISNLKDQRVNSVSDVVSEGDIVKVKIINIDELGRYQLSMKAVKQK